ncbi:gamma-glutamyl-gamma-aminobutyrate hydrolase family protein [Nitriliruptor alkaliphilus]|uniref:gamma-glutamyl-gamma-aminobutyrate hydrolase family protein n=1 Tax=Nitriliruptor alkaliphilus TaxID=427918 RepID=UPI0009FAE6E2|nr:gamma-glutamyl-gamma-aminobutyrate hydrolase family protein [Nitriliruptor alkaliphilus]
MTSDDVADSTRRPLIAVAGLYASQASCLRFEAVVAARRLLDAVQRAGGDPVVLYPVPDGYPIEQLARFDGVLLPGGADVDPSSYGSTSRHVALDGGDPAQDAADCSVALAALDLGRPLLAVCRGTQILNVALGGTLVQHLEPDAVGHRDGRHEVILRERSVVARTMGTRTPTVSSYHHQAIARLGADLVVTGRAPDGVIEAIEHTRGDVIGVQWHPEDDADEAPAQQALFDWLVAASRRTRRTATATEELVTVPRVPAVVTAQDPGARA